jgi:hypothetical protein
VRRLELKEKIFVDGELRDKATIVFKYNKQGQLTLCNKKTYENGVLANETEIEYTYNSMGNVSQQKETATVYDRTNGACISKKETAYTFNGNGTLAKQHVQLYAWKGGNYILVDETLISYFYDRLGQRTMMKTVDKNFDNEGNYRGKMVETCHYDDMGRISGIVTLTYDSTDTLISKEEVTYEYDENGNRIIVTYHTQYDGNGNEQERSMTKEIVDQNGNVISQAKVVYDKDGNIKNAEANELQQRLDLLGAQNDERNVQEGIVVTHEMADPYKEENRELLPQ